jgi:AraC family transcriptional regulator
MDWVTSIQKVIDYVEENITEELDGDILAEKVNISGYYMQRVFAILCNCTIGEYIRNRRLTLAGAELMSTDESIIDIALKYGYETHESFTRAFTRFHGVTPSIARKDVCTLNYFPRLSIKSILEGKNYFMSEFSERGYVVKETGAVYYTKDMDKTLKWFKEILGWYGEIESRNEDGSGGYGCVTNIPREIEALHIAPFTGIHMFYGEPKQEMVAFMLIQGVDALYEFVKKNGWEQITKVNQEPWGSRTCSVTTIDGSILKFFE